MLESVPFDEAGETDPRVIKRYSNRKLYDTQSSKYVTLQQIAEMVRNGDLVQIIDNRTKEDKTEGILALIVSEELKASPGGIPLHMLRSLIRQGGGTWLNLTMQAGPHSGVRQNRELEMGDSREVLADARAKLEQWRAEMDERLRLLPDSATVAALQRQVKVLNDRLAELERRLGKSAE